MQVQWKLMSLWKKVDENWHVTLVGSKGKSIWIDLGYMDVSKNGGTPKSSILIGFSIINQPFWGTRIFGNTHIILWDIYSFQTCQAKTSQVS